MKVLATRLSNLLHLYSPTGKWAARLSVTKKLNWKMVGTELSLISSTCSTYLYYTLILCIQHPWAFLFALALILWAYCALPKVCCYSVQFCDVVWIDLNDVGPPGLTGIL